MKKRYFIVAYVATNTAMKCQLIGQCNFETNQGFLNRKTCVKWIEENSKDTNSVVITNVIEVSEEDYKDWRS